MIKLISCHIENFGNLSGEDFSFHDGINSFLHDNGWGKSTLASFLKAMFYGLPKVSQKDASPLDIIQERERFSPWSGNKFGGWLIFELAGQQYKIVRYFGKTEKSDHFELLEVRGASLTPTQKFSSDIGEELFSLDKDSFERSVFITLDPSKAPFRFYEKKEVSGIKNKLLELVENVDESCDYQLIQDTLNKALVNLKSSEKSNATGVIPTLTKSLEEEKELLRIKNEKYQMLQTIQSNCQELQIEKERINIKLKEFEKEKSNSDFFNKKGYYQNRLIMLNKLKNEYEEKLKFFNGMLPNNEKLDVLQNYALELNRNEIAIQESNITEQELSDFNKEKNLYSTDLLSFEELDNYNLCLRKLNNIEKELAEKKFTSSDEENLNALEKVCPNDNSVVYEFEGIKQEVKDINLIRHDIEKTDVRINEKEDELSELKKLVRDRIRSFKKVSYIISVITFIISLGLVLLFHNFYWIFIFVSAVFILLSYYFLHFKHQKDVLYIRKEIEKLKKDNFELINELNKRSEITKNFFSKFPFLNGLNDISAIDMLNNKLSELMQLKQKRDIYYRELDKFKSEYDNCKQKVSNLIRVYGQRVGSNDPSDILSTLKTVFTHISVLEPKILALRNAENKIQELQEVLGKELNNYSFSDEISLSSRVELLLKNTREIQFSLESIEAEEKQIAELEKDGDFYLWKNAVQPKYSPEEIKAGLDECKLKIEGFNREITLTSQHIEQLQIEVAQIPELELRVNQHNDELNHAKDYYSNLCIVKDFIEKAHKDLSEEYMHPMIERFSFYFTLFGDDKKLRLNNEMDVYLDDSGETHGVAFFSSGYRDIMNFCARLAFIDVIFKDDSTLIILDDPFVNFDAEKISVYKSVLQSLSSKRQIFYFTCHESRMI